MDGNYYVQSKQDMLMGSLKHFFSSSENLGKMIPILTQKSKISLRLLDWFVTNYAKKNNIGYFITYIPKGKTTQREKYFNVFLNYKSQLKAYSKQQFDPFCRKWVFGKKKTKVYCGIHFYYKKGHYIETTVGQLNFFRWIVSNKVLDYAIEHLIEIQRDMMSEIAAKKKLKNSTKHTTIEHPNNKKRMVKYDKHLDINNKQEKQKNEIKYKNDNTKQNMIKKMNKIRINVTVDFS